ncbi:MAG: 2Fe-2S iron-sulfur cluster binding domain-containing protein [Drouetiella hepatica Uher 2000/2452]|jgi:hypothetical protein|uniref:2Fe-2S iron-sulfur cluster binding domain-containing protein n=1 Tax=Drouetiella hepatica Uher 2000/2452 TaxID=904376 RepID=A0A951URA9_9CYAN|nr:2Fe-2S iron-sulfur cluster binding domain-containing protein [Drouetiella hepatica Uher 2000/2452]
MVEVGTIRNTVKNPVVRAVTGAAALFSIATILSGIGVGFIKPKDEAAQKFAFTTSLISLGCGAVLGAVARPNAAEKPTASVETGGNSWADWRNTDWRNFVVVRKVRESQDITSFYLQPEDQAAIPDFQPGQFLTIRLDIPGQKKPTIRTYSLSDYAKDKTNSCQYYRLSIKREAMSSVDVPPGLASNFMHDQVQEGSVIQAKPPSGKFFLDLAQSSPAVLISNGVGITPMMSMIKACGLLKSDRPLWFIHGARDGAFHAFHDEVLESARQNPNLNVHFRYSRPRSEDLGRYHSTGYVDAALIDDVVSREVDAPNSVEYYICGSAPFLQSLREGFNALGIPEHRIFYEVFGGGKKAGSMLMPPQLQDDGQSAEIVFAQSGTTLTWQPEDGTILECAEANGLEPAYSCRQGICLTCMCRLESGEVTYVQPPVGTPDEGSVLICIAQPKTAIVLDL